MCSYSDFVRNQICLEALESSSLRVNGLETKCISRMKWGTTSL